MDRGAPYRFCCILTEASNEIANGGPWCTLPSQNVISIIIIIIIIIIILIIILRDQEKLRISHKIRKTVFVDAQTAILKELKALESATS